jgi:hypothetical protein
MRSIKALVAAATIVLSYPLALGVQQLFDGGAETVIHFVTGAGFVLFATSVFDFELPRWVNVVGAVAAAAFGAIFLMQGVADLTNIEPLRVLAFDVVGHHVERLLPDVVYLWFAALLLLDSAGRSRILGWVVMLLVVVAEVATLAALVLQFSFPNLKVLMLLPFVWLLFESTERRGTPRQVPDQASPGEPAGRRATARR